VYRLLVVDNLQSRYLAVAGDILDVSISDFGAILTAHRAHVRQCALQNQVNYDTILEMLVRLSASTMFQPQVAAMRILSTGDKLKYKKGVVVPTQSITRHNKSVPLSYI